MINKIFNTNLTNYITMEKALLAANSCGYKLMMWSGELYYINTVREQIQADKLFIGCEDIPGWCND